MGAYGSSMPSLSIRPSAVPARPQITSALGLFFSASSLAATMPVESRTHWILMSGWAFSKAAW
ncbi:Uncharacterised protein [Bordetella pertussis]|nr:Uncharacterised protein [Bordetella pertussis]CPM56641.1 Uncharacterised protein [Bordetella pertussis]